MSNDRVRVILCRSSLNENDSADIYKKIFNDAGFSLESLATINFEFINQKDLRNSLLSSDSFSGLILTSSRSVDAMKRISEEEMNILERWKDIPTYCVGSSTESAAKSNLYSSNCLGSESGNAENLAKFIVTLAPPRDKPFLYPCSEIARDTIEKYLVEREFQIKKIVAYRTVPCANLKEEVDRFFETLPQVVVFFSPSVVENILSSLGEKASILKNTKIVAIGPVTEKALTEAGFVVDAVPEKPEPESLLRAVERLRRR